MYGEFDETETVQVDAKETVIRVTYERSGTDTLLRKSSHLPEGRSRRDGPVTQE